MKVASKAMLTALAQHRERRRRERAKVAPAVEYPDWRRAELARKYSDEQYEDRHERSFYHPFG